MEYVTWKNMTLKEKQQYKKIVKFWNIATKILIPIIFIASSILTVYIVYKTRNVINFLTIPILFSMVLTIFESLKNNSNYILEKIEEELEKEKE